MYSMNDLISEIAAKVNNLRSLGAPILNPDWIVQDILNDHPEDVGGDAFYACVVRATIRKEALRYLGSLELENQEPDFTGRSPDELKAMAEGCRKHTEELTQIILDDLKEIAPLLNLHEDGHIALGYSSWAAYCEQEFHK
jgi:hypothetical protein